MLLAEVGEGSVRRLWAMVQVRGKNSPAEMAVGSPATWSQQNDSQTGASRLDYDDSIKACGPTKEVRRSTSRSLLGSAT